MLLYYMPCGMRLNRRWQHIECLHRVVVAVGIILRYLHWLQLFKASLLLYLVVTLIGIVLQMSHISDVSHISHLISKMFQIAK